MNLIVKITIILWIGYIEGVGLASAPEFPKLSPKIAVIGGGLGGTATAYYLRQNFGDGVKIDVFEAANIGGRLPRVKIDDLEYEMEMSVIHPLDLHLKHLIDQLGLPLQKGTSNKLAIFDGKQILFQQSDWSIMNFFHLFWRYGFNPLSMQMWVESFIDEFMRIYQFQQHGYFFSSVEKLLRAMGGDSFLALTNRTLEEIMLKQGFSQVFINDIVAPIIRVNYGQSVRINSFAGILSLAAVDESLGSLVGGNRQLCNGLLYQSKSELINAKVTSISFKTRPFKSGSMTRLYEVNYNGESGAEHSYYDIVIIAMPLQQGKSDIAFTGFLDPIPTHFPGRYERSVTTLIHGLLNVSYLGISESELYASEIITTDLGGGSVCSLRPIDPIEIPEGYKRPNISQAHVWKVVSTESIGEEQLQKIFRNHRVVLEHQSQAHPDYRPHHRRAPPIILHDRLYYLNAMEWLGSTMEMSTIAARNVALLSHGRWSEDLDPKLDQENMDNRVKGEL